MCALRAKWITARNTLGALGIVFRQIAESALRLKAPLPPGVPGPSPFPKYGGDGYYLERFRRYGPYFTVLWGQRITICVVGFARASRLLAQHARMLLPASVDLEPFVPHGVLRVMQGETHAYYRRLFLTAMGPELASLCEPKLRAVIREELARLAEQTASDRPIRRPALATAIERMSTRGLIVMMFGLEPSHPMFKRLEAEYLEMGPAELVGNRLDAHQRATFDTIRDLVRQSIAALQTDAKWAECDGVLPRLVRERSEDLDETVIGNLAYLVQQGRYDMGGLMRWIVKYLTDAPDVVAALRARDRDVDASSPGLAEAMVLETLRLDQATALHRVALEEFVFDGYRFPKNAFVKVPLREAHQDAEAFPEPERFKPCRFVGRSYSSDEYAPFGFGEHRCLASHLVLRTCTILVEELVDGYAWSQTGDSQRVFGRYHWEPAPTFDIRLTPRVPAGLPSGPTTV